MAVTSPGETADALSDPLLRREPMESVNRVVEDHINHAHCGTQPNGLPTTTQIASLNLTPTAFKLSDVVTYVGTSTDLYTVNPSDGTGETDVTGAGVLLPGATPARHGHGL